MYGELLLLFSTLYNILLVVVCCRLLNERPRMRRTIAYSFLSGCCSVLIPVPIIASIIGFGVLVNAFHGKNRLRKALYLLVITCLLGGMLTALQTYATTSFSYYSVVMIVVLLAALLLGQLLEKLYMRQLLTRYEQRCTLIIAGHEIDTIGFIDTGNQSTEPLSGRAVHFASVDVLDELPELKYAFMQWCPDRADDVSQFPTSIRKQLCSFYVTTVEQQSLILALCCTLMIENECLEQQYIVFVQQPLQFRHQVQIILNASVISHIKGDRYCYEA